MSTHVDPRHASSLPLPASSTFKHAVPIAAPQNDAAPLLTQTATLPQSAFVRHVCRHTPTSASLPLVNVPAHAKPAGHDFRSATAQRTPTSVSVQLRHV